MIAWLVVDGVGVGVHRLVFGPLSGSLDQLLIGEVGRADPAALGLADLVIEPTHRSSSASLVVIVAAFGFPEPPSSRCASR
ncbi:hypothetical protein GCM10027184_12830 [Saccharothrix stipae]